MTRCRFCQVPENLTPGRYPWGDDQRPPAWHCHLCHRHIGLRATHFLRCAHRYVLCGRCEFDPAAHSMLYPGCAARWHDLGDHRVFFANRAGAWRLVLEGFYERVS